MTSRIQAELTKLLPTDFNREVVIQTERLDAYDLLDPTSKASQTVRKWIDDLPKCAVLFWRPPRRPWVVFVPTSEVEGIEFEYGMRFGEWVLVGVEEWLGAVKSEPEDEEEELRYYSPFQIDYDADVYVTQGDDRLTGLLAEALSRVPGHIVDRALEGCRYLMVTPENGGVYLPANTLGGRSLVLLPHTMFDDEVENQIKTVLHETAHFICGHKSPLYDLDLDYDAQEREANELVEKWLRDWEAWKKAGDMNSNEKEKYQ